MFSHFYNIIISWFHKYWKSCSICVQSDTAGGYWRNRLNHLSITNLVVRLSIKLGLIDTKYDNSWSFKISFQYILARWAKIYWKKILKSPRFVIFSANMVEMCVKNWDVRVETSVRYQQTIALMLQIPHLEHTAILSNASCRR